MQRRRVANAAFARTDGRAIGTVASAVRIRGAAASHPASDHCSR